MIKKYLSSIHVAFTLVFVVSCATGGEDFSPASSSPRSWEGEVSLKADRDELAEARKNIPQDIQKANDELAFDLSLMGQVKEHPSKIRQKFQSKVQKIREKFRNEMKKIRENYNKSERKEREALMAGQRKQRDEFKRKKADREQSKEFYAELDRTSKEAYSERREKRYEFEDEMRSRSKEFNESMRERMKQFTDELKVYSQRYYEREKCKREKRCDAQGNPLPPKQEDARNSRAPRGNSSFISRPGSRSDPQADMREFEDMKKVPGTRLQTDGE